MIVLLRSDPTLGRRQRRCLHEHWKNCHDYPEAHTWESHAEEDIEEEEAVRTLVAAEDDSYLAYDKECKVRQLVTGSDLSNKPGGAQDRRTVLGHSSQWNLAEDSCVLKMTNNDKQRLCGGITDSLEAESLFSVTILVANLSVRRCHFETYLKLGSREPLFPLGTVLSPVQVIPEFRSRALCSELKQGRPIGSKSDQRSVETLQSGEKRDLTLKNTRRSQVFTNDHQRWGSIGDEMKGDLNGEARDDEGRRDEEKGEGKRREMVRNETKGSPELAERSETVRKDKISGSRAESPLQCLTWVLAKAPTPMVMKTMTMESTVLATVTIMTVHPPDMI
ncbi:hypothetical protein EI94DRAFT_1704265 [Lactarius quietus]|nr:hypothetical protein EI94DRAFT_1704265 [Lactarius quietus]